MTKWHHLPEGIPQPELVEYEIEKRMRERLKQLREERGVSKAELARQLHKHGHSADYRNLVWKIEEGEERRLRAADVPIWLQAPGLTDDEKRAFWIGLGIPYEHVTITSATAKASIAKLPPSNS